MKHRTTHPVSPNRAAYTLVEMLIASILVATLMATVWNLISLYSGFLNAGRAQAEEQQLARSLIDIISAELHALIPNEASDPLIDPPALQPTADPTNEQTVAEALAEDPLNNVSFVEDSGQSTDDEPTTAPWLDLFGIDASGRILPQTGIHGGAHTLTLNIVDTEPNQAPLPIDESTGELLLEDSLTDENQTATSGADELPGPLIAPEYRRIVYQFVPPRLVEGLTEEEQAPGLYRYEVPIEHLSLLTLNDVPALSSEELPENANVTDVINLLMEAGITSIKQEHVPEVVGCEFEYLTEFGWNSSWSPRDDGRTLRAVRIRLRLLSSDEHDELMTALGATEESDVEFPAFDEATESLDTESSIEDDFGIEDDPVSYTHLRAHET